MIGTMAKSGFLLVAVILVATACETSREEGTDRMRQSRDGKDGLARMAIAGCESAIVGNADRRWREKSTIVGNLGFYGPGRDFKKSAQRAKKDGDLVTKLPVIIEGSSGATVSVPRDERHRMSLLFGDFSAGEGERVEDGDCRSA